MLHNNILNGCNLFGDKMWNVIGVRRCAAIAWFARHVFTGEVSMLLIVLIHMTKGWNTVSKERRHFEDDFVEGEGRFLLGGHCDGVHGDAMIGVRSRFSARVMRLLLDTCRIFHAPTRCFRYCGRTSQTEHLVFQCCRLRGSSGTTACAAALRQRNATRADVQRTNTHDVANSKELQPTNLKSLVCYCIITCQIKFLVGTNKN